LKKEDIDNSSERLLRIVITTSSPACGWEKLAPRWQSGKWPRVGRCELIFNPQEKIEADFWIIFANARIHDCIRCAPENTLLVVGEPAEKKVYPEAYYHQFYRIIDTHKQSGHPRVEQYAPCLSWHVGLDHDTSCFTISHAKLSSMPPPDKVVNKVSVICSNAAHTQGQRERLAFLKMLKKRLGDRLVHFGRGFQPVADKLDAIHGFRFHLVLENCRVPHYWTEKIADAYLGWSFPFYIGAPNIHDYFPSATVENLDFGSPDNAAERIASMLAVSRTADELDAIAHGRDLILNHYNPWCAWARWAEKFHQPDAPRRDLIIRSHKAFRPFPRGLIFRLKGALGSR
jgi:hypothetical protein